MTSRRAVRSSPAAANSVSALTGRPRQASTSTRRTSSTAPLRSTSPARPAQSTPVASGGGPARSGGASGGSVATTATYAATTTRVIRIDVPSQRSRASMPGTYDQSPTRCACLRVITRTASGTRPPPILATPARPNPNSAAQTATRATASRTRICRDHVSRARLARPVSRGSTGQAGSWWARGRSQRSQVRPRLILAPGWSGRRRSASR
ncbi:hypothetical protein ACFQVD_44280 [Streptosporangium amethystogenes subsp. fukuiense]|uniref:Uncharacterized protein n=1 Tax=Streptosporangium amethystogenes subsp. fukuiense TaxID=698418 RepID=A0ABW2TGM9_9ACTN